MQWLVRTTELGFGALLADDMGLGKTLTVIAFHLHRLARTARGPTLVVCPASLLANWEREFARFAPDCPGAPLPRGQPLARRARPPGQVVVTTYGTLLRDAGRLAEVPWDIVVADEAQQVKNHRSQAARALRSLPAGARIAVTGTPVENSLSELWAILDWTNPGLFGTLAAFRERYGRAAEREAGGGAARRLGRLISPFLMRRRKTDPDVAPELPEKVVSDRYVELTREQAALYQAATADTLARIAASAGIARRGQVLRLLQSLRQICNSPAHFLRESSGRLGRRRPGRPVRQAPGARGADGLGGRRRGRRADLHRVRVDGAPDPGPPARAGHARRIPARRRPGREAAGDRRPVPVRRRRRAHPVRSARPGPG